MATFNLKSFSQPETLKTIARKRLIALFTPFLEYLKKRGLELPDPETDEQVDFDKLIHILMTPDDPVDKAPANLVDLLYLLDEMSTPQCMDALLETALDKGLTLPHEADQSPIDLAVHACLVDRNLVELVHNRHQTFDVRTFEYCPRAAKAPAKRANLDASLRAAVEAELDDWFEKHRRGRGTRLFVFQRTNSTWILVRHGRPLRREGSIDNGQSSSVVYRPECFDVLVHDHTLDELRIHAQSIGEQTLYREVLGHRLFDNKVYFGTAAKYTLDPIRVLKRDCLVRDDVAGIEWIKLIEVQFFWGGAAHETEIRKAPDVYSAYEAKNRQMPLIPKIMKARFEIKFTDSKTTRKVLIDGHKIQCRRDSDRELIEKWLAARGFHAGASQAEDAGGDEAETVLVDAGNVARPLSELGGVGVVPGFGTNIDIAASAQHRTTGVKNPIVRSSSK